MERRHISTKRAEEPVSIYRFSPITKLVGILLLLWPSACVAMGDMCGNRIVSESIAPDASAKFVVFTRDCGATTGTSTQASILDADVHLGNQSGNVLILGSRHHLDVEWVDRKNIRLMIPLKAEIFKNEAAVGKITLDYVLQPNLTMESLIDP